MYNQMADFKVPAEQQARRDAESTREQRRGDGSNGIECLGREGPVIEGTECL